MADPKDNAAATGNAQPVAPEESGAASSDVATETTETTEIAENRNDAAETTPDEHDGGNVLAPEEKTDAEQAEAEKGD